MTKPNLSFPVVRLKLEHIVPVFRHLVHVRLHNMFYLFVCVTLLFL